MEALEASWNRHFALQEVAVAGTQKGAPPAPAAGAGKSDAAEAKKARELRIGALRESLGAKDEKVRIQAILELGEIRDRNARSLLAEKLGTDTAEVRRAAAAALVKQKHPAAAAALGNALGTNRNSPELLGFFIRALGELDMDDSIKPLLSVLEFKEYEALLPVLKEIEKIGCSHAVPELLRWLKRSEAEERKPVTNQSKDLRISSWAPQIRSTLGRLAGGSPKQGESWDQFLERGGMARKMVSIYLCETAGKTFECPAGKAKQDCPFTDPTDHHEDTLLKHRPE